MTFDDGSAYNTIEKIYIYIYIEKRKSINKESE